MGLFSNLFDEKTTTEATAYRDPYPQYEGHMDYLAGLTGQAIQTPLEMFPGQTYAGQTDAERQAIEQLRAGAGAYGGMMGQMFDPAMQAYQSALGGPESVMGMGLQDVASNPYLSAVSDAIQSRVNRNLQENILPSLSLAGVGGGGLGGTWQGVAEGIAGRGTSEALAEQLAGLYGGAWQAGLGAETSRLGQALSARQGALGMAPGMLQTALSGYTEPAALLGQAGRLERAEEQRAIDEAMARHEYGQMEPWRRAEMGFGLVMPPATTFARSGGTSEVTRQPSTFSRIGQLASLAGAIGGGVVGGGLGGPGFGAAGGYGMGAPGYGAGYGINPFGQQAGMLADQWGTDPYQFLSSLPSSIGIGGSQNPWMWGG